MGLKARLLNLAVALDQFLYVLLTLGAGAPDETMSSAAWRTERKGRRLGAFFRPKIDALFVLMGDAPGHCRRAFEAEQLRQQLPEEFRP